MSLALVFGIGRSTAYPLQAQAPLQLIIRKAVHVGEYAFLGFVASQCLSGTFDAGFDGLPGIERVR